MTNLEPFAKMLRLVVLEAIQGEKRRLAPGHPDLHKWLNYEAWQLLMYLASPAVVRAVEPRWPQ